MGDWYWEDEGFIVDNDGYVNVWVDGSCLRNGQPGARAGYGVVYDYDHYMNVSAPVKGRATNNAGEIQAATRAIRDCGRTGIEKLRINTDSDFLRASVCDRLPRWERNGFRKVNGDPLANQRDFMELSRALEYNSHMDIEFYHVPAHAGDEYNEEADRLAKEGAMQYRPRYN
ncbi:ribonuclease H1-like [Sitodiplosis mosellana]|uniref:ribonuclease H1-like n=1 Tax=Sitodiplosis mosellana TaxID=263140 RepID=UPI002443754E|nr:ribonuclease H1-like [Sitodiplosis mosellana]